MSLGKELASIRKSKNLSLEDIQNAVKIPLDTLKDIENDRIFSDSSRNKTYVRSFVRSYAKYLKIEDDVIVKALDEIEEGTYSGTLYDDSEQKKPQTTRFAEDGNERSTEASSTKEEEQKTERPAPKPVKPKPVQESDVEAINWADMGRKFTIASKKSRTWVVIIAVVAAVLIAGAGYFFWNDISGLFGSTPEPTEQQMEDDPGSEALVPTPVDSVATTENNDESSEPEVSETNAPEVSAGQPEPIKFGDTLTVAVYAAYGQLEPVRVTSDLNWRTNPFWMEQGEAYNFDFRDTLLIRGQYSRLLLMFNGHVIENPRQNFFAPSFNSIMITRSVLRQERFLTPQTEFPLEVGPPDSIIYRIRF